MYQTAFKIYWPRLAIMRQWHFQVAFSELEKGGRVCKRRLILFKGPSAWHFWLAVYWKVFFVCHWCQGPFCAIDCITFLLLPQKPKLLLQQSPDKNELSFCPWIKESTTALERPILSQAGVGVSLELEDLWVCKFLFLSWPQLSRLN